MTINNITFLSIIVKNEGGLMGEFSLQPMSMPTENPIMQAIKQQNEAEQYIVMDSVKSDRNTPISRELHDVMCLLKEHLLRIYNLLGLSSHKDWEDLTQVEKSAYKVMVDNIELKRINFYSKDMDGFELQGMYNTPLSKLKLSTGKIAYQNKSPYPYMEELYTSLAECCSLSYDYFFKMYNYQLTMFQE